tara:strand:- start:168 stop:902 length:735 start_codon:yes stop_codon:yes gene_type:complete
MNKLLENKNCVITGASGDIGISCAKIFHSHGANLILIYNKNKKPIVKFQKEKKNIISYKCDLTNSKELKKLVKKISIKFSEINTLVNCSGIMEHQNYFLDENLKNLNKHLNINSTNLVLFTKLLSRIMIRSNNPSIINITSVAANYGIPSLSNYSISKGAVKSFTLSSARELGPLGIRVNSISPGIIATKLHNKSDINKFKKNISLGRLGKPEEVGYVALFLASHYSSYINGQELKVDGQIKVF